MLNEDVPILADKQPEWWEGTTMRHGDLFILFMLAVLASTAAADTTYVSGAVTGTWTADHSPYIALSDLNVPSGFTLNINSGVTVFFGGRFCLRVDSLARLSAEGVEGDSIRFTTDTLTYPERWKGIRIHHGADTSRLRYCVFEFAAGDSAMPNDDSSGGALFADSGYLELTDCTMHWNRANAGSGGAAFFRSCHVRIQRCRFENNSAENGGAIATNRSSGTIDSCVFRNNSALRGGGLIILDDHRYCPALTIHDGWFEGNRAQGFGGAVTYSASQPAYFEHCTFRGNSSGIRGGALSLYNRNGDYYFRHCLLDSNHADSMGGCASLAFAVQFVQDPIFEHCVITRNSAREGGAIYAKQIGDFIDAAPEVAHCVIAENSATITGGAFGGDEIVVTATAVVNTVRGSALSWSSRSGYWGSFCGLFGNEDGNFPDGENPVLSRVNLNGDSCDASYNLYIDPRFVDAAGRDYHLTAGSPYIDAGPFWAYIPIDPDGTRPDIGAFYFPHSSSTGRETALAPANFHLSAYPNPFNPTTKIQFVISKASHVSIRIFDLLGRETAALMDNFIETGGYNLAFDGSKLSSGLYAVRIEAGGVEQTIRVVLLR